MNSKANKHPTLLKVWEARYLYILIIPAFVLVMIFCYGPMYGVIMAFKDFKVNLGILKSPWVGLKHFKRIFITKQATYAIWNTLRISICSLAISFPLPIILALLINEMRGTALKKFYQVVYTFPHFLSWVIVATVVKNFLSLDGPVNALVEALGKEKIRFLADSGMFRPLLYGTGVWKGVGWSSIIYMAAIAGIDPTLYDAAKVDGATRFQQMIHVTLPGIKPTIIIMLILACGGLMDGNFDAIFNLRNAMVHNAGETLDTYIYSITFAAAPNYSFSTAVGLFKAVINFVLLTIANGVAGKLTGQKLFS